MTRRLRRLGALADRVLAGAWPGVTELAIGPTGLELGGLVLAWADPAWEIDADGRISWPERRSGPGVTPGPADLATGDRDKPEPTGDQPAEPPYHRPGDLTTTAGER